MLGAIADDFTGATDLATMLRRSGHRVAVVIDDGTVPLPERRELDAIVIALKTRTAPRADAIAQSVAAIRRLRDWGATRFYDKYCSTFDSTDEGNIGTVLDAVADELGATTVVVVPSLPANGRTVYRGHLFVGDQLLEHSPMRQHPLTPMTRSRVAELLRPQTTHEVGEVMLDVVRRGPAAVAAALNAVGARYVVVDAIDDDDLSVIGAATSGDHLVSGGSGLALGIDGPKRAEASWSPPEHRGSAVLCGSVSAATRRQIAAAEASHPVRLIDLERAAGDLDAEVSDLVAWVAAQGTQAPIVCAARAPEDVRETVGGQRTALLVEAVLAAVSRALVDGATVSDLIIAGGETSGAVVQALGVQSLRIGPEIAAGVCWSTATTSSGASVVLALKSGNFGADDLFTSAWEAVR